MDSWMWIPTQTHVIYLGNLWNKSLTEFKAILGIGFSCFSPPFGVSTGGKGRYKLPRYMLFTGWCMMGSNEKWWNNLPETNQFTPLKIGRTNAPKRKRVSIPTIHFQGQIAVSFWGSEIIYNWQGGSIFPYQTINQTNQGVFHHRVKTKRAAKKKTWAEFLSSAESKTMNLGKSL